MEFAIRYNDEFAFAIKFPYSAEKLVEKVLAQCCIGLLMQKSGTVFCRISFELFFRCQNVAMNALPSQGKCV